MQVVTKNVIPFRSVRLYAGSDWLISMWVLRRRRTRLAFSQGHSLQDPLDQARRTLDSHELPGTLWKSRKKLILLNRPPFRHRPSIPTFAQREEIDRGRLVLGPTGLNRWNVQPSRSCVHSPSRDTAIHQLAQTSYQRNHQGANEQRQSID